MGRGRTGYQPAGIYGWRKQCLYAITLFILVVVIMNLALTVWILRVLNFDISGLNMGTITIGSSGISVGGRTELVRSLYVNNVTAAGMKQLNITSKGDITLKSVSNTAKETSGLHIGRRKIDVTCEEFEIKDLSGHSKLKVTDKAVTYGVNEVTYSGKAVFNGSIETPNIRGPSKGSLRLNSASSTIEIYGREGVHIDAVIGNIELIGEGNIIVGAKKKISLNGTAIYIQNLNIVSSASNGVSARDDVYQLCMCRNGRLFLAPSSGICAQDGQICY
ncbi:zeta-sarcoglycan-like [Dreissena polymorpha]|uniref:Uncharacterized protein n=1 Tax=Dreissena polymorpha TaxID=45954 RepID=A0A9D4QU13_DREPO|nr:zeta-sarcoglycan-like [Dreissena polymorpha]KAH3843464.1 hypothetical protein DPMN_116982 [Dreissena polymorpha]